MNSLALREYNNPGEDFYTLALCMSLYNSIVLNIQTEKVHSKQIDTGKVHQKLLVETLQKLSSVVLCLTKFNHSNKLFSSEPVQPLLEF